jgi:protein-S-isoprenylcysteine O-methyltransferase Ste14
MRPISVIGMPWWVELVSIVLPVLIGLGMVFVKTTMQRRKIIEDEQARDGNVVTGGLL